MTTTTSAPARRRLGGAGDRAARRSSRPSRRNAGRTTPRSAPSTASTCASSPVRSSPSSAPTAPARRRRSTWCSGSPTRRAARPRSSAAARVTPSSPAHVSAVLQTGGLLRDLTVRETVRMIASTYAAHAPVDEVIDRAGLTALADRRVSKCSGGEQQRLRFALALLPDPRLLVLDEPTAGMDVTARRDFWDTMHADASAGRTVVFATHYLEEADAFADRIVLVAGGRIVADGTTAEIRSRASGRTVSATLPDHALADAVARLRDDRRRPRRRGARRPRRRHRRRLRRRRPAAPRRARWHRPRDRHGRPRGGLHGPHGRQPGPPAR